MPTRIINANVEVGTSATQLVASGTRRRSMLIHNLGGATIYVGGPSVTVADGLPIPDGETLPFYSGVDDPTVRLPLYAIAAAAQTSPADTRILEITDS